jgi:hemoglobin
VTTTPPTGSLTSRTGKLPDLDSHPEIARLVRDFYRQVAMDDLLGPIFAEARIDWSTHISKLVDFWCKQLLGEPGYEGNPLRAHTPIHERTAFAPEHYRRWLDLFVASVDEHFTGPYAELAKARALRMARAMQRLLSGTDAPGSRPVRVSLTARNEAATTAARPTSSRLADTPVVGTETGDQSVQPSWEGQAPRSERRRGSPCRPAQELGRTCHIRRT